MSSTNNEVFLKKIVNNKKFLSRSAKNRARQRGYDIPKILDKLSKYEYELKEDSDLPRLEYMGAVERYLFGFYEDSIRNSVISVEIGLIVKLNEVLPDSEKNRINQDINREKEPFSFTFGSIVSLASNRKYKILKGKIIKQIIESLIKQRNIHFHSSTFLSGARARKNLQMVTDEVNNHMNKLKIQSETIIEDVKKDYKKLITIKKRMSEIIEDKYMKSHALKILYDSFDVLTHINIF